jgi:ceramide glucosyltransferase
VTWLAAPAAAACGYYLLAIIAAWRWQRWRNGRHPEFQPPPISILKPVRGRDPRFYEGIRSHALQDYPEFELLFGLSDPHDPALEDIRRLAAEFPERPIRVLVADPQTPNAKVGVLAELALEARYPVLLVNDSDIVIDPDYLKVVVAPLENPEVGVVTCLYRASADSWPTRWEALGVATEFMPSVLVARLIGVSQFVLGSTMVFRAADLRRIGGFQTLGEYLADDYQLGRHIAELGYKVAFARTVVETNLGSASWRDAWAHQVRWARTIRVSQPGGYYGYALTQASVWAALAFAAGAWKIGLAALLLRLISGVQVGGRVLGDRSIARQFFLIPLRDAWGFAVWLCGCFGKHVVWRGKQLRLRRDGRLESDLAGAPANLLSIPPQSDSHWDA